MAFPEDVMRIIAVNALAVNSSGGATVSTSSVSSQTYAVDLVYVALGINTSVARFAISDRGAAAITSVTGAFLPPNWIQRYKIQPGQIVQVVSADASTIAHFQVIELSK